MRGKGYNVKKFTPRKEKHEFPKGEYGIEMCKYCGAVYYKKGWQRALKNHGKILAKFPIKKVICPADKMIQNKQFEGEIIIKNIPEKIKNELINLAKDFGERAFQRNNQHRIINIKIPRGSVSSQRSSAVITTTENQMALQLAKKIKNTFKKASLKISYSPAPSDVVYVTLTLG